MATYQKDNDGKSKDPIRLTPKRFSGLSENEESGLIVNLFTRKTLEPEDKTQHFYEKGYNTILRAYADRLQEGKTPGGQPIVPRMDYRQLWDPVTENLALEYQVMVEYNKKVRILGFETGLKRKVKISLNSATLEDIAQTRKEGDLEISCHQESLGKLRALIDLSFEALKSKDLTLDEGKVLVQNTYLALYITKKELSKSEYDLFCKIEKPKSCGEYLTSEHSEEITKFTKELRRKYQLGFKYESKPIRKSKELEKELTKKIEEEDTAKDLPNT